MNEKILENVVVIYQQKDGRQGIRPTGGFLPQKSWPVAFYGIDDLTRLTNDPIEPDLLEDAKAILEQTVAHTVILPSAGMLSEDDWKAQVVEYIRSLPAETIVAFDCSGSTPKYFTEVFQAVAEDLEVNNVHVVAFDAQTVIDLDDLGSNEALPNLGGSAFNALGEYSEKYFLASTPVVVVTDGYGFHYHPANPEQWTWIVTPGGDTWMNRTTPAMKTVIVS